MAKTTAKTKGKIDTKKLLVELKKDFGVSIPKEEESYALSYIKEWYEVTYDDYESGNVLLDGEPMTPHDYALATIANGLNAGEHMDNVEITDLGNGLALQVEKDQDIVEVDQNTVKQALKRLLTKDRENDELTKRLALLYDKWEEYNNQYFFGELSYPLITIEKMNNRTLGNYTHGEDQMGITNHIRFNINFVALNTEERILETLRHEMIHQWQDEVLYQATGEKLRTIKHLYVTEDGEIADVEVKQKKRPKDWHNKDFKEFAKVVGIPAKGSKCYGNPANMPEPKSYNRKFICGCVASNNYPLTIWSTRAVNATCKVCKQDYKEVKKGGKVIKVAQSHVEKPGEDAIQQAHSNFEHFKRFKSKEEKDEFSENLAISNAKHKIKCAFEEGVYQKGHNMYKEGYTHWVAYRLDESTKNPSEVSKIEDKMPEPTKAEPKEEEAKKAPKKSKPSKPKEEPKKAKKTSEEPKKAKKQQKKEPQPMNEQPTDNAPTEKRSHKNAEDLLALYKEFGSIKGVAEYFGKSSGTIIYQAKQLGVDFKKGVISNEGK